MKHKHAELIKAWADGAEIQYRPTWNSEWFDCIDDPKWSPDFEYRIKPKPDVVAYATTYIFIKDVAHVTNAYLNQESNSNLKLTFDGETGKLKSAEVIK
jgi:hypothetical protein